MWELIIAGPRIIINTEIKEERVLQVRIKQIIYCVITERKRKVVNINLSPISPAECLIIELYL